jgi:hypothetical protein
VRPPPLLVPLLVLAVVAAPAAADVDLVLSHEFRLSQATFLAGNVSLDAGAVLRDPVMAGPRLATIAGTLTVCPQVFAADGVVRPIVLQGLAAADPECDGAQTFEDPVLAFGPGTRLAFGGALDIAAMPGASLLAPFGNNTVALALGGARQPLHLAPEDDQAAFAATAAASSVVVLGDGDPVYFNGTSHAYFVEGDALRIDAAAVASPLEGPFRATVVAAGRDDMEDALADPFALLDAQETLFGADAREPRGNVSALLREYGRVPAYVDGAILGRLNGTAGGSQYSGDIGLVRGEVFALQQDGQRLFGTEDPRVALSPAGVAFTGGEPQQAPWTWALLLWVIALLVLLVRRRAPRRASWLRLLWPAAFLAALVLFEWFVLQEDFGAGLATEARDGAGPGTLLALATFEVVLVAASFVALALPGRLLIGRLVPQRWVGLGEAVWAVVWAILPVLLPAAFFALGYDLARL